MKSNPVQESLELCRPGSKDHLLSELSPLAEQLEAQPALLRRFQQTQENDARIAFLCHDVRVPGGLAGQILSALSASQSSESSLANVEGDTAENRDLIAQDKLLAQSVDSAVSESTPNAAPCSATQLGEKLRPGVVFRRSLFGAAIAAGLTLCISLCWYLLPTRVALTGEEILAAAPDWLAPLLAESKWSDDFESAPLDVYPPDSAVVGDFQGWQHVALPIDQDSIAYLVTLDVGAGDSNRARAVLLVSNYQDTKDDLSSISPLVPYSSAARLSLSAWQRGSIVYVLLVDGDARLYRRFLRETPIAQVLGQEMVEFEG